MNCSPTSPAGILRRALLRDVAAKVRGTYRHPGNILGTAPQVASATLSAIEVWDVFAVLDVVANTPGGRPAPSDPSFVHAAFAAFGGGMYK